MPIDDLWYKNAVIYCLDVETFQDANGDGIGDMEGLQRRLDYLHGLGVTCIWLQPFYGSPNRDNGYDVSDYYSVHEEHGSLGDYVSLMQHARALGMRVIVDLVVSHTSVDHPWFRAARADRRSPFRDWYVWADERPRDHKDGIVFPGTQRTNWTWDRQAGQYYFHRFYSHQADLNTWNPHVRAEIKKIMGFWLQLGVSGFRMDAVPFLIEKKGAGIEPQKDYGLLKEMRTFLQWRSGDATLLAEANVPAEASQDYFGDEGDHLQMMLNFPVNQRLFYALATGDIDPLARALEDTRRKPPNAQWVQFLRSHDELDLGRLTAEQRQKVFDAFAPDPDMQLYERGIRRRLAPMLGDDRRRLEFAFGLLLSLPGTPMLQYGDEIGMGDDLSLPEREGARTPMQWTAEPNAGFSRSRTVVRPVIAKAPFGYATRNVEVQRRDPASLLNWLERIIRMRKECPEISWGNYAVLRTTVPEVLALCYDWRNTSLVTLHNFSNRTVRPRFTLSCNRSEVLVNVFLGARHQARADRAHQITLKPWAWHWLRVGDGDNVLARDTLDLAPE